MGSEDQLFDNSSKNRNQSVLQTKRGTRRSKRAITPKAKEKAGNLPKWAVKAYLLAMEGRSYKLGIRAFCCECVGYSKADIRDCTGTDCPLFAYRPFQGKGNEK